LGGSSNSEVRFEILATASVQITVSLVVTLCSLVDRYPGNLRIWQYSGFSAGLVETVFVSVQIITDYEMANYYCYYFNDRSYSSLF
jgi:hypothetical protein